MALAKTCPGCRTRNPVDELMCGNCFANISGVVPQEPGSDEHADGPVALRETGVSRRHRGGNGAQSPIVGDGSAGSPADGASPGLFRTASAEGESLPRPDEADAAAASAHAPAAAAVAAAATVVEGRRLRLRCDRYEFEVAAGDVLGRMAAGSALFDAIGEVSREHARIVESAGEWAVEDLGSTNGTFVNGDRLPPHQARRISSGDRVGLSSKVVLVVV